MRAAEGWDGKGWGGGWDGKGWGGGWDGKGWGGPPGWGAPSPGVLKHLRGKFCMSAVSGLPCTREQLR